MKNSKNYIMVDKSMLTITSKKINTIHINLPEEDNSNITKWPLNLTLWWWWWWCNKDILWWLNSWEEWDLWVWPKDPKEVSDHKEETEEDKIIEEDNKEETNNNNNNFKFNSPLNKLPLFKRKWQSNLLKKTLLNSPKWIKKNNHLSWENFFILWLKKWQDRKSVV